MSFLTIKIDNMEITKIWLTDDAVHILTADGREAKELFADYARLRNAPKEALENFTYDSFGIHWRELNEDLAFDNFFQEKHENPLYKLFLSHPEINVSALARRMGISQSLMAQYVSGGIKPSKVCVDSIIGELRKIGSELLSAAL